MPLSPAIPRAPGGAGESPTRGQKERESFVLAEFETPRTAISGRAGKSTVEKACDGHLGLFKTEPDQHVGVVISVDCGSAVWT